MPRKKNFNQTWPGVSKGSVYIRKHKLYSTRFEYLIPIIKRFITSHTDKDRLQIRFELNSVRTIQAINYAKDNPFDDEQGSISIPAFFGKFISRLIDNDLGNRSRASLFDNIQKIVDGELELPAKGKFLIKGNEIVIDYSMLSNKVIKKRPARPSETRQYSQVFNVVKRLMKKVYYEEFGEAIFELNPKRVRYLKSFMQRYRYKDTVLLEHFLSEGIGRMVESRQHHASLKALRDLIRIYLSNELGVEPKAEISIGEEMVSLQITALSQMKVAF